MDTSTRIIRFDDDLQVEAYQFVGLAREFPNHFHDCYVIGLMETGERRMTVNQHEYRIGPGDLLLFNPLDNHACEQIDGGGMNYRCLNIKPEVMAGVLAEVRGVEGTDLLPKFSYPLARRSELALLTGFSDQSHFTGYFTKFTGLPPRQYQSIFRDLP